MRAILAASATTTVLGWERESKPRSQAPSRVSLLLIVGSDERAPWIRFFAQIAAPALCDAEQPRLAASGRLPRYQAQPGGKIPTTAECSGISDRCHQRGRVECADAGDGQQPPHPLIRASSLGELGIEICNPLIEGNPAQTHIADEPVNAGPEHWLIVIQHLTEAGGKLCAPLRNDIAAFEEKTSDLVHQRGTVSDQLITNAVQRLHIELLLGLQLHKPHRRASCRFRDRLGIAIIVLLRLD